MPRKAAKVSILPWQVLHIKRGSRAVIFQAGGLRPLQTDVRHHTGNGLLDVYVKQYVLYCSVANAGAEATTDLPGCDACSLTQHGLQPLQQQAEHKYRLASHHLLAKVGDILGVQLTCLSAKQNGTHHSFPVCILDWKVIDLHLLRGMTSLVTHAMLQHRNHSI